MANWFISINGEQKGPYPTDQLRQLISDGFVARDSYVWREGMAQWQPLSQVRIADDGPAPSPSPVQQVREPIQSQQFVGQAAVVTVTEFNTDYQKPGYFSFNGRIGRQTFWLSYVLLLTVLLLIALVPLAFVMPRGDLDATNINANINYAPLIGAGALVFVVYVVMLIAMLSAYVKRLHDRGRSGWFVLLAFVPIVQFWILIEVAFLKGTDGPNDFGPDPVG